MNPIHNNKEWQADNADQATPSVHHYSATPLEHPSYGPTALASSSSLGVSHGVPMHPPLHQPTHFMPTSKSDTDPRLPGMMALPQPGTPLPASISRSDSGKKSYGTAAFHAAPYSPHHATIRKRGRNDSVFSTEHGPFFLETESCDNLYALDRTTPLTVRIHSKFDRGFFLADNEWTCYRRNYFQVSSAFSIPGLPPYYPDHGSQCLVSDNGQMHPVERFYLGVSARVAGSDKVIQLIQHTPKRDKGPQSVPERKPIVPGGHLAMSNVNSNQSVVTFERIQFKSATANNGKRRAAQQYFVCVIDLYAQTDKGHQIKIGSCQSAQLVVRGRSPGHYSDSHERYDTAVHPAPSHAPTEPHAMPHDDRFLSGPSPYSRPPPLAPPSGMPGPEYGSSYSYYSNYSGYPQQPLPMLPMMLNHSSPPTPTLQQQFHHRHPQAPPHPSPHPSVSSHPSGHSYMVPGLSDPSSSETSSPDMYTGDMNNSNLPPHLQQPQHQHPPHNANNGLKLQNVNLHMDHPANDWSRSRYHSASSHDPMYFSSASPTTPISSTAPVHYPPSPYDTRKYSSVPNLVNQ